MVSIDPRLIKVVRMVTMLFHIDFTTGSYNGDRKEERTSMPTPEWILTDFDVVTGVI